MYLDYWKLNTHPFNNLPDTGMYFDMHQSAERAIAELLFSVEDGRDRLDVLTGPPGVGVTTALRMVLEHIREEKHNIAFVTNPDLAFPELLREIIGQLQGRECLETRQERLLETLNRLLLKANEEGKRTLILIDESSRISPKVLDRFCLLTNMRDDSLNLFTLILAGQPELERRLKNPKRDNLFQRIGVYCKIDGIGSLQIMTDYIEHRLKNAGLSGQMIFTRSAYEAIWKYSDGGNPRVINKICKLSLIAGQTNRREVIDRDIVIAVADRFKRYKRATTQSRNRKYAAHPATPDKPPLPAVSASSRVPDNTLTREAREELASRLASEQFEKLRDVSDPFDTWITMRRKILKDLSRDEAIA